MCLWARGLVEAPIDKVFHLFLSNDYVQDYNPMCQECLDIGWLDRATRLTWATSRRVGPISPRDFVTRCHYRKLRDGTLVVAQMSEQLPCLEFRANGLSTTPYTRMEVQLCGSSAAARTTPPILGQNWLLSLTSADRQRGARAGASQQ